MFRKILIANRGEIAVRIAQTVQQMGVVAVGLYSDTDCDAAHLTAMDQACRLEGHGAGETYLNINKVIDVARQCGADAVHPGYGFLSENAAFAEACADAGVTFIGPAAAVIEAMGDKVRAKRAAEQAGVPVVPGWSGDCDDLRELHRQAKAIGYPVLVKAASGGGGKGMRVVKGADELESAVATARRESAAAFGDSSVFLEKYLTRPRHVEVQIFGDAHGQRVHLSERDCSIQRRHQKIVEEACAPALQPTVREALCAAAVHLADALDYTNAGTVEFLLDESGQFYFLEVNTRLQVEHPVTELICRQDLVAGQIVVAAGDPLPFTQDEVAPQGHALECRIYAEDPARGFLPATGTIEHLVLPGGPYIRVDCGVRRGTVVGVHFDPLLAKLIVWAPTRDQAIARMRWALAHCVVLGVQTNLEFLQDIVGDERFAKAELHTGFLEGTTFGNPPRAPADEAVIIAALAGAVGTVGRPTSSAVSGGPWDEGCGWRMLQ